MEWKLQLLVMWEKGTHISVLRLSLLSGIRGQIGSEVKQYDPEACLMLWNGCLGQLSYEADVGMTTSHNFLQIKTFPSCAECACLADSLQLLNHSFASAFKSRWCFSGSSPNSPSPWLSKTVIQDSTSFWRKMGSFIDKLSSWAPLGKRDFVRAVSQSHGSLTQPHFHLLFPWVLFPSDTLLCLTLCLSLLPRGPNCHKEAGWEQFWNDYSKRL